MLGLQKCGCYLHADGSMDPCYEHEYAAEIRLGLRADEDEECTTGAAVPVELVVTS